MGLYALALLIGALLALGDRAFPDVRSDIRAWIEGRFHPVLIGILVTLPALAILYLLLWLHYYEVEAPSREFRAIAFTRRAVQYLPLILAGAVVGFAAVHWLTTINEPKRKHVVSHGIAVGAAGLLVLGLFVFQDPRLAGVLRSVNTPVFSLEFTRAEETARPINLTSGSVPLQAFSGGAEPIAKSLSLLIGLGAAIERDVLYIKGFAPKSFDQTRVSALEHERKFFAGTLAPLARCMMAIRERVRDNDPIIVMDAEAVRVLRVAHRHFLQNSDSGREAFRRHMHDFAAAALHQIFQRRDLRLGQHRAITPPYRELDHDIETCRTVDYETTRATLVRYVDNGWFSSDAPYFSLVVAALLNLIDERPAAVEELDAWLKQQRAATDSIAPQAGSGTYLASQVFRLRAEYWAGYFLTSDLRSINTAVWRFHRALQATDEIFRFMTPASLKVGMTLEDLMRGTDSRRDEVHRHNAGCRTYDPEVRRLLFSGANIINGVVYYTIVNNLDVLHSELSGYVRKYHDLLGYVEAHCFDLTVQSMTDMSAAFIDTYLAAKRSVLRDLPQDRARHEICAMSGAVDRATALAAALEAQGSAKVRAHEYAAAEAALDSARGLRHSIRVVNDAVNRIGARAC